MTNVEKKTLKKINRYLENFKEDLEKLQKYQYNITYGLDYLFDELEEVDYHEPKEVKSAFDGSYILYDNKGVEDSNLSVDEYFDIIRPYLRDMIDNHKAKGEWKIQLLMQIIFVSFTDANETREMHTKSDNITIMIGFETEGAINELFNTFRKRYQEGLETKLRGSSFTFKHINLLEYDLHKISLNRGSLYIESPDCIKNKAVTINPKNTKDNNCFQYAIIAALNYQNIDHHPERISKLKAFINNYSWKSINFPAGHKDYSAFERNNRGITLNILYIPYNTKEIRQAYISKLNNECDTQVYLLMITDETNN